MGPNVPDMTSKLKKKERNKLIIKDYFERGLSVKQIARKYGISQATVSIICRKKSGELKGEGKEKAEIEKNQKNDEG